MSNKSNKIYVSVSQVHVPTAMENLSIRSGGKKFNPIGKKSKKKYSFEVSNYSGTQEGTIKGHLTKGSNVSRNSKLILRKEDLKRKLINLKSILHNIEEKIN